MRPLRALIVDDEAPARRRLARMLAQLEAVTVAGEAADGEEALRQVDVLRPDVVFLDVRMPALDGLAFAQRAATLPPIVFITAHDTFAVQAFEVCATDYLLKPVRLERLSAAVEKVRSEAVPLPPLSGSRIVSSARGEVRFFEAKEISRFWASDKYTVFRDGGEEHLTEEPLSTLEARLAPFGFLRIHRAELVNLAKVKALRGTDGMHSLELADGQQARVSRRFLPDVRRALGL
jgi:DNA-binding LytR/AlgR family response regulator